MTENESTELPTVYQAELDADTCSALFRDWSALDALEVSVKHAERAYVQQAARWTLSEARAAFDEGMVRAIQVRYVHEDRTWTDTLLRQGASVRLVRMAV